MVTRLAPVRTCCVVVLGHSPLIPSNSAATVTNGPPVRPRGPAGSGGRVGGWARASAAPIVARVSTPPLHRRRHKPTAGMQGQAASGIRARPPAGDFRERHAVRLQRLTLFISSERHKSREGISRCTVPSLALRIENRPSQKRRRNCSLADRHDHDEVVMVRR